MVGILGYGSLIDDPGDELECHVVARRTDVDTPFRVEYARSSRTRGGGPTLVPVSSGGASVHGWILMLDHTVSVDAACDMLYRRESRQVGSGLTYEASGAGWIHLLQEVHDVDVVLYTALAANIEPLTPEKLALLAVNSVSTEAGAVRRDGVSYLIDQRRRGVDTPLTASYEAELLRRTGATSLEGAWSSARGLG